MSHVHALGGCMSGSFFFTSHDMNIGDCILMVEAAECRRSGGGGLSCNEGTQGVPVLAQVCAFRLAGL
jgi:hypothetical protein